MWGIVKWFKGDPEPNAYVEVSEANPLPVSVISGGGSGGTTTFELKDGSSSTLAQVDATYGVAVDIKRLPAMQPATGTLTNRSGTVTAANTSQQVMAANANRRYLFIQNVSTADLYIDFGASAVSGQPSVKLVANASYVLESSFVTTQAVNILGGTIGQAFTAKEG